MESLDFNAVIMEAERLVLERLAPEDRTWARSRLVFRQLESDAKITPIEESVWEVSQDNQVTPL